VGSLSHRQYVMLQATPLYVGFPREQELFYSDNVPSLRLGGLVEPIGFGAPVEDLCGLATCPLPAIKSVPRPPAGFFAIANATGASSWAPGSLLVSFEHPAELLRLQNILLTAPYFSPNAGGSSRDLFVGDGENVENQGEI
jgi:hypothetical protein